MKATKRNLKKLTPNDREEFEAFREFLADSPTMTPDELWDKYGESYLGPRPVKDEDHGR